MASCLFFRKFYSQRRPLHVPVPTWAHATCCFYGNVSDVGDDGELSGNEGFAVTSEEAQLANECENEDDSGDESNDDASGSKTTKKGKKKRKTFLGKNVIGKFPKKQQTLRKFHLLLPKV